VVVYAGDCDTLGEAISQSWIFTYDGDGNKVKQEYTNGSSSLTTYYYAGGAYEVQTDGTSETVRQYYAIGGVSVGMTTDGVMSYFLTDHLGSIVAVTDNAGTLISETRYMPFGEVRTDVGTISETNYGYTNQEVVSYIKLMFFKSRWYSPELGRFVSPDSIVPDPTNSQSWNRYSYVNNRPMILTDPSGHMPAEGCGEDGKNACHASDLEIAENAQKIAILNYDPSGQKQKENSKKVEKAIEIIETVGGIIYEPLDWMVTAEHCITGECSPWYGLALLPLIPASLGRHIDDIVSLIPAKKLMQFTKRGWSFADIEDVLNNPALKRADPSIVNRTNGNPVTYFYRSDGYYIVQDDITGQIIQVSDTLDPLWVDEMTDQAIKAVTDD